MRRDGGYVTLATLVVCGLLAGIVSTLVLSAQPTLVLTRLGVDDLVTENLLDSGATASAYLLFTEDRDAAFVDGRIITLSTGSVTLQVAAEAGRLDLNASPPELLKGLFKAVDGQSLSPDAFAARVVDWRDGDDERTPEGAERSDYRGNGARGLPMNAKFQSVGELRFLKGLSENDYMKLESFLTVHNRTGMLDPGAASRKALLAIPGMSEADATTIAALRNDEDSDERRALVKRYEGFLTVERPTVFRVNLVAHSKSGRVGTAEMVVADATDTPKGYVVYAWTFTGTGGR
ncbi:MULTISPECIES: general secretion pathway protein GspK [unclassified Rhizobium]|uniref:general secretion pathway protein GspK n=1 Tax=unclassified Rhizobium TaxID=2613769 RepID=UPI00216AACE0|nr:MULTISPECIES: general secretion pathway protein GspK [unclassified Rhizobium]MCS3743002.1 general secretion pathway protein K [Rhizobium sp. BK661]MCS4096549.1 general secretion pathway protein K [Rhizobium sp. BK176]